jgi:hypothetical protein
MRRLSVTGVRRPISSVELAPAICHLQSKKLSKNLVTLRVIVSTFGR